MQEVRTKVNMSGKSPYVLYRLCLCRLEADRCPLKAENTVRYRAEVPFGDVSVAVEPLWLLAPLECGVHEDEAVSLCLRTRHLVGVLLRKR